MEGTGRSSNRCVPLFDFEYSVFADGVEGVGDPVIDLPVFLLGLGDADGDSALEIESVRGAG